MLLNILHEIIMRIVNRIDKLFSHQFSNASLFLTSFAVLNFYVMYHFHKKTWTIRNIFSKPAISADIKAKSSVYPLWPWLKNKFSVIHLKTWFFSTSSDKHIQRILSADFLSWYWMILSWYAIRNRRRTACLTKNRLARIIFVRFLPNLVLTIQKRSLFFSSKTSDIFTTLRLANSL